MSTPIEALYRIWGQTVFSDRTRSNLNKRKNLRVTELPIKIGKSSALEIVKTHLEVILCNLLKDIPPFT